MKETPDDTRIALISKDISYIQKDVAEIKISMKELVGTYVTSAQFDEFKKTEFGNMKKIVFGAVGLILTAFALAVINFFLN